MNSGDSMRLGTVRFTRTDSTTGYCTHDTIRCSTVQGQSSVVQDSLTALVYPGTWGKRNPIDSCTLVGLENRLNELPTVYKLYENYPNPFNPATTIKYALPIDINVTIKVYDILGRLVTILINNESKKAGYYEAKFDGMNYASGVYFYKLEAGDFTETKRMALMK